MKAYTYNLSRLALAWDSFFVLKNLKISLIFLEVLAEIEEDNLLMLAGFLVSFFLDLLLLIRLVFGV